MLAGLYPTYYVHITTRSLSLLFFVFPAVVADVVNVVVDVGCRLSAAVAVAVAILSDLMKYFAAYGLTAPLLLLQLSTHPHTLSTSAKSNEFCSRQHFKLGSAQSKYQIFD